MELGRKARHDIGSIHEFSAARFGQVVADEYVLGLSELLMRIADYPESGVVYSGAARRPLRVAVYRSHRVFYDYDGQVVRIVRVLHQAMDVDRWLH